MRNKDGSIHRVEVPWMSGGLTMKDLQKAKVIYLQKSQDTTANKISLDAYNLMLHIQKFKDRRQFPLELHIAQIIRLMLLSKEYILGPKWPNSMLQS